CARQRGYSYDRFDVW
nr:immunoglobulin heavy chain junction region [Macaca mulatta]MOV36150.1 immunoglobulin heavy chain junction region [Macaca mulatta]MOV36204.1 immunoglobulin heavy chain junction region [Macaca mulatta]MOV36670.1 immunoglobulin heavy chain junction region [Macaca mulatta]